MIPQVEYARTIEGLEAEIDNLTEENERLRAMMKRIIEHGIPKSGADEKTWLSCLMNIDSIAREALKPQIERE